MSPRWLAGRTRAPVVNKHARHYLSHGHRTRRRKSLEPERRLCLEVAVASSSPDGALPVELLGVALQLAESVILGVEREMSRNLPKDPFDRRAAAMPPIRISSGESERQEFRESVLLARQRVGQEEQLARKKLVRDLHRTKLPVCLRGAVLEPDPDLGRSLSYVIGKPSPPGSNSMTSGFPKWAIQCLVILCQNERADGRA